MNLAPFGLPGCTAYVGVLDIALAPEQGGAAYRTIDVPNTVALAGVQVFQQAVIPDAGASGGASVSDAGEAVVGLR